MVLSALPFSLRAEKGGQKKQVEQSKRFWACFVVPPKPDSVSLHPENRQWTFNPAHHSPLWNFQGSLSPYRTTIFAFLPHVHPLSLSLFPLLSLFLSHIYTHIPFPAPGLTVHIPRKTPRIMESLAEGQIVTLNARPCIFIFQCRMMKKSTRVSAQHIFHFSSRQLGTFIEKFLYFADVIGCRVYASRINLK